MGQLIHDFVEVKNYLLDSIDDKLDLFLTDMWDPLCKFVLVKELYKVIKSELHEKFPEFPVEYLPNVRLKVIDEELIIEKHIQGFFNNDKSLMFLANLDIGTDNYDLYYKKSYDLSSPFIFIAKYGHDGNCVIKGAKTAAAEYFMGKCTPLSVAFQIAQEEGIV